MNEHEFKNLYHDHGRNLYNFILWITVNRSICEDILQEVFVKLWRCETVPAEPDELRRWLLTVTRRTCLDFLRKSSRFARLRHKYQTERRESPSDPDAPFLWEKLENLPEMERSILYLHLKIGHTYREIADMFDLTENRVRVRAFRALKRLRETLTKKEL
ncbi:MAG: RNA polymerase sigma factor [Chitinispirillaceae bacterium]|nr:RNA polymerase sigma factor [Chitinispirillaceae bacterium]